MTWSNAIFISVALIVGAWLLIQWGQIEQPVERPNQIEQPVERPVQRPQEELSNTQLERLEQQQSHLSASLQGIASDIRATLRVAAKTEAFVDAGAKAWVNHREQPVKEAAWRSPHRQVVLVFYDPSDYQSAVTAGSRLKKQGHIVYRVDPHRQDMFRQFNVQRTPTWLVVRDDKVIYQSSQPPRFPRQHVQQPVESRQNVESRQIHQMTPVYRSYQQPVYRSYQSGTCTSWGCN